MAAEAPFDLSTEAPDLSAPAPSAMVLMSRTNELLMIPLAPNAEAFTAGGRGDDSYVGSIAARITHAATRRR